MSKIKLKPNSADFLDDGSRLLGKLCDHPECELKGEYRAPRNRDLNKVDYHYFCLEHVQDYNRAWNFFDGMSDADTQDHIKRSYYGDRPTWKYDGQDYSETLRHHANTYREGFEGHQAQEDYTHQQRNSGSRSALNQRTPETEALEIMGLTPPLTQKGLKARYKQLVKKHHPDVNQNRENAEEKIKEINMAYTVLSVAYECFQQLDNNEE